jgi:protoheme IX farnesyltransferase
MVAGTTKTARVGSMRTVDPSLTLDLERARLQVLSDLLALTKPRVVVMVLVTTVVGFYLGSDGYADYGLLFWTLLGTGLAAAGSLTLNQYMERDYDARMERTRNRPLPSGRLQPVEALAFGAALTASGLLMLTLAVNTLSGLVTALTVVSYLLLYTPMKLTTPLCSLVGAVPGALPPVTGWVAATGSFGAGAWVLFAILFLWQLPHSLAIAKLYAEDYARAGFRLLPIVDREGRSTERQIVGHSTALLMVGLVPTLLGLAGPVYFVSALVLGCSLLFFGIRLAAAPSQLSARRLLFASLVYLPVLLAVMAADKVSM